MSGNSNKIIPFAYTGSKFSWLEWLYTYFPVHKHFIDVFCGSMVVTLNKPASKIETVNDINSDIINFFRVLRENPEQLIMMLQLTPVSREEFNNSWGGDNMIDPIEKARRFYVRVRQSIYSMGAQQKSKGWHLSKTSSRSNVSETVSKWINGIKKLDNILIDRLRLIQIENQHYRDLIPKIDFNEAFFYLDPPYPPECRKSKNDYKYDFTEKDHIELAELINNINGKAMISSYDCPLMRSLYKDWDMIKFPPKKNNIRNTRVEECIWINYQVSGKQANIFI